VANASSNFDRILASLVGNCIEKEATGKALFKISCNCSTSGIDESIFQTVLSACPAS